MSLGAIRNGVYMTGLFAAGAVDRLDERRFAARHHSVATVPSGQAGTARDGVRAGLAFLEVTQRANGLWRGFMLPPGASTEWISAHVVVVLQDVEDAVALTRRAAEGLRVSARPQGWGYNRRIRLDSDSTAQAILALARFGHGVEPGWVNTLMAARHEEGGFATFASTRPDGLPRTWWDMPHADVTLFVAEALERINRHAAQARCAREWLEEQATEDVLPAHWWTSPAYSLWAQSQTGFRITETASAAAQRLETEHRPVYLAMLINAALAEGNSDHRVVSAVTRLLAARLDDGSWPCDPCMRTTSANHPGGWDAPGPVSGDPYRVFSTAHAVAALSRAREVQSGPEVGPALRA
jgi:hypothetical protein